MNVIYIIIYNVVFIAFPLLLHAIFVTYKSKLVEAEEKLLLELFLFCSLFLTLTIPSIFSSHNMIYGICSIIPLFICYIKRKRFLAFFISIILIDFFINSLGLNLICIISHLVFLFLVYEYYSVRNKSENFLTNIYYISTVFFITVCYILKGNFLTTAVFKSYALVIIVFSVTFFAINEIIGRSKGVTLAFLSLRELEREKQIRTSLFKISHEIKNPIAVIKGYLEMYKTKDIAKCEKYIDIIRQEVDNTLNILNDFSDLTKINVVKEKMDFIKLLEEMKDMLTPFFNSKDIRFGFKTEEDIIINADYNRLKQVLLNVVKNAIEASRNHTKISFTSYKSANYLIVIISDEGDGMDKETLDNLFTPFFTTKDSGTGLGLCLSKEIIEAHNGNIYYTSYMGIGTTVKIILPLV